MAGVDISTLVRAEIYDKTSHLRTARKLADALEIDVSQIIGPAVENKPRKASA